VLAEIFVREHRGDHQDQASHEEDKVAGLGQRAKEQPDVEREVLRMIRACEAYEKARVVKSVAEVVGGRGETFLGDQVAVLELELVG